ncbi:MAG TPA: hypothetical protein VNL14_09360 [Candidatus Acidoferrales bacterium]|nr:hypothetical protein [Candidatus Acidoferrales bacterium]
MRAIHRLFISWMLLFVACATVMVYSKALNPIPAETSAPATAPSGSYLSELIAAVKGE